MNYSVQMQYRDFSNIIVSNATVKPIRWSWHAVGGCDTAMMTISNFATPWDAINWLRRPVTIYAGSIPVWWGYINEVTVAAEGLRVGASLDNLYNSVAVAYAYVPSGITAATSGDRLTTAYDSDSISTDEYGTKQYLASLSQATTEQATAYRDDLLAAYKWPMPIVEQGSNNDTSVEIHCRGWWHTLNWQYYTLDDYDAVVTTTQISTIVSSAGEFITSTDIRDASSLTTVEYRDGDETALSIIEELLASGTDAGSDDRRLLATISSARALIIEKEPASTTTSDFVVLNGQPRRRIGDTPLGVNMSGNWMDIEDLSKHSFYMMSSPTPIFVEWSEFDAVQEQYRWMPKGAASPFEIVSL